MATMDSPTFQDAEMKSLNNSYFSKGSQPRMTGMKIAITLAFLFSLASLGATGLFYQMLNIEQRDRVALEAKSAETEEKIQSLTGENDKYREEIARMGEQLKSRAGERDEWKGRLDEGQAQISSLQEKVKALEENNKALEVKAKQPEVPSALIPQGASSAVAAAGSVALSAPTAAGLPTAASASQKDNPAVVPAKTFQVMSVNRKFNFAVINVGVQDQIKLGDQLKVERNGKIVGKVQIEKVYDRFAAAAIVEESKESPIKEGDAVKKS